MVRSQRNPDFTSLQGCFARYDELAHDETATAPTESSAAVSNSNPSGKPIHEASGRSMQVDDVRRKPACSQITQFSVKL